MPIGMIVAIVATIAVAIDTTVVLSSAIAASTVVTIALHGRVTPVRSAPTAG